MATALNSYG